MNKQVTYLPSRSADLAYKATEAAAIASIAFPPLLLFTLPALAAAKERYYHEVEEVEERHVDTEREADSIAQTWESNRRDGETGVDVEVRSCDGSGADYSYSEEQ